VDEAKPGLPGWYSVVVPVYNEADTIGAFCLAARQHLKPSYELLVCYDFDEDTTLAALESIPESQRPENIRLVRNRLGKGVRYAIEAGLRAARHEAVVVTMVDLSDNLADVERMLEEFHRGADVDSRGGGQIGGPLVKRLLSRAAGLSLYWLAGLPTRDATNSFKVYRRSFLERTVIESTAGFCLGLELTVKAHFSGGRVAEVPTVWQDRSAGQSRFRLWKWLPHYLHWYFWALRSAWLRRRPK
jgi:glycosyltransferase involved in cell wall biosynthesis